MRDFCVTVTFTVVSGAEDAFLRRMRAQARASLSEPGCRVFDVWTDQGRPGKVYLYEIYDSEAAFDEHLSTRHFRDFDAATADLVEDKTVGRWSRRIG